MNWLKHCGSNISKITNMLNCQLVRCFVIMAYQPLTGHLKLRQSYILSNLNYFFFVFPSVIWYQLFIYLFIFMQSYGIFFHNHMASATLLFQISLFLTVRFILFGIKPLFREMILYHSSLQFPNDFSKELENKYKCVYECFCIFLYHQINQ